MVLNNKKANPFFTLILASLLLTYGCNESNCRSGAPQPQEIKIEVIRTEDQLFRAKSVDDVLQYLEDYPVLAYHFWHNHQYPNDSILAARIWKQVKHPSVDTVYKESVNAFKEEMAEVESTLEEGLGRLKSLYPDARIPSVYSTVSVFYNDLYVSDSLVIIGLDHFIGPGASYAPQDIPAYILKRYDALHLPAIIMQFIAGHYTYAGKDNTLLSDMIDFGKTYYLTSRLLPCTADSLIIGYTPENMIDIEANKEVIWANFVENQILYETNHEIKRRFLSERPQIYEISQNCPGRIGAWVGWQIVESYMNENEVSIQELMENRDHHEIFEKSGYKPRNS
jgi:hypothetical protein